jgi:hypothetical protein
LQVRLFWRHTLECSLSGSICALFSTKNRRLLCDSAMSGFNTARLYIDGCLSCGQYRIPIPALGKMQIFVDFLSQRRLAHILNVPEERFVGIGENGILFLPHRIIISLISCQAYLYLNKLKYCFSKGKYSELRVCKRRGLYKTKRIVIRPFYFCFCLMTCADLCLNCQYWNAEKFRKELRIEEFAL